MDTRPAGTFQKAPRVCKSSPRSASRAQFRVLPCDNFPAGTRRRGFGLLGLGTWELRNHVLMYPQYHDDEGLGCLGWERGNHVLMFPTSSCTSGFTLSLAMADCASGIAMVTGQGWSCTPLPALAGFSASHERAKIRLASRSSRSTKNSSITSDVELGQRAAKKWRQQLCLRTGVGLGSRGLRYSPWRTVGSSLEVVVESPEVVDILTGGFLIFRGALTEADVSSACLKWMLSVGMAVCINFMPWTADIASAQSEFEGSRCDDVAQYYSQASGLKGEKLKAKLHEIVAGHKQLSYAQVWNALKILDAADTEIPDTSPDIVDIYSLKRLPKSLQGSSEGWNREHLWPRSYGLMEGRPEFTDVHNLRPADANVNSSRGNKYFGDCTTLETTRCLVPANREAGADTATDVNTWRPPSQVRGDIARAVFYMAVRYGIEQPSGNLNLQLSDSPSVGNATMGLLSALLQWNNLDPPSPSEVLRSSRVCSLYQGNRNPFVDHPEYASSIWGAPDVVMAGPTTPGETSAGSGPGNDNQLPNTGLNEIHITPTKVKTKRRFRLRAKSEVPPNSQNLIGEELKSGM